MTGQLIVMPTGIAVVQAVKGLVQKGEGQQPAAQPLADDAAGGAEMRQAVLWAA